MQQYRKCHLVQIYEAQTYFLASGLFDAESSSISKSEFDELFGQLLDDTDQDFEILSSQGEPGRYCNPYEVLCIFALLSSEPIRLKIEFFFYLHMEKKSKILKSSGIVKMFHRVKYALVKLFDIITVTDSELTAYTNGLIQFYIDRNESIGSPDDIQSAKVNLAEDDDPDDLSPIRFQLTDFLQFCQDTKDVWRLMEAVNLMTNQETSFTAHSKGKKKGKSTQGVNNIAAIPPASPSLEGKAPIPAPARPVSPMSILQRQRHPLWQFCLLDMMDDSWFNAIPAVHGDDLVFAGLEHLVLGGRRAIPIFVQPDYVHVKRTDSALASSAERVGSQLQSQKGTFSFGGSSKFVLAATSMRQPASSARGPSGRTGGSGRKKIDTSNLKFYGMIDYHILVGWVAECCPALVISAVNREEQQRKLAVEQTTQGRQVSRGQSSRQSAIQTNSVVKGGLMSMQSTSSRSREKGPSSKEGSVWQSLGEEIAMTPLVGIFDGELNSLLQKPTAADVIQLDQFVYNVIDMVARGFRVIPVAGSAARPTSVTHTVTDLDVVKFLRNNAGEMMGSLAHLEVQKSGLLKSPLCIPSTTNYGSALLLMARRNVDTAIILDDAEKVGGRISVDTLAALWLSWKQQTQRFGSLGTLEEMRKKYAEGSYQPFDGTSGKVFSIFSTLMSPLKLCESVGVKYADFESCVKVTKKSSNGFTEDDEYEDTDSDDSDSESASSNSSSGGSR